MNDFATDINYDEARSVDQRGQTDYCDNCQRPLRVKEVIIYYNETWKLMIRPTVSYVIPFRTDAPKNVGKRRLKSKLNAMWQIPLIEKMELTNLTLFLQHASIKIWNNNLLALSAPKCLIFSQEFLMFI